jgi:hypothetical protein
MIVSYKQLCEFLDCHQVKSVKKLLDARGIRSIADKHGRPCTTASEIDRAMRGKGAEIRFSQPPGHRAHKSSSVTLARSAA